MPSLELDQIRRLISGARVAHLGTVDHVRGAHVIPITFALVDDLIVTSVDHKPKRSRLLRRIGNIERNHDVTVLVDHYEDDWTRLWWCLLSGTARVIYQGAEFEHAVDALVARYQQYREVRPSGPVIRIAVTDWTGWAAAEV